MNNSRLELDQGLAVASDHMMRLSPCISSTSSNLDPCVLNEDEAPLMAVEYSIHPATDGRTFSTVD